jgi:hypothetical protein
MMSWRLDSVREYASDDGMMTRGVMYIQTVTEHILVQPASSTIFIGAVTVSDW